MSFIYFLLLYFSGAVEIDFEKNDAAFFIRESNPVLSSHKYIDSLSSSLPSPSSSSAQTYRNDSLRPLNQFIITKNNEPISIRASYGPFSSKQSIPFSDFSYQLTSANQSTNNENVMNAFNSFNTFGVFSIHLVGKNEISFETPTIRVLFHRSKRNVEVCAAVQATFLEDSIGTSQRILLGQCSPDLNEVTCLIEITPSADWWPSIQRKNTAPTIAKEPMRLVDLSYSFLNIDKGKCSDSFLKRQTITYLHFDTINLVAANGGFKEIRFHDRLSILIPGSSIYPSTKLLVPIMFDHDNTETTLSSFYLKARIKNGVRILKTYPGRSAHNFWNITTHLSNKKTSIRIHIVPKNAQLTNQFYSHELQWWLLEIGDRVVKNESSFRLFWSIKTNTVDKHKRPFVDFDIQKDDIQAIVPISKSQEILNTAVLNGYQVSQSLKVFIVSFSGKASDVTLQSNCYSENENVLKVSSSCSSVFIDGSENRGSLNASILIKYGTLTGLAKFIVWLPEFPLNIVLNDYRLSQIKGWKTEHSKQPKLSPRKQLDDWKFFKKKNSNLSKQNTVTNQHEASHSGCKLRFQQTQVEVFARFSASDAETGSTLHYNNHRTFLKITELTTIRISDPKIASIKKNVIQGLNIGRADVQVISPFANNVLASAELRVTGDRVAIVNFTASVISGLQLSIRADMSTGKKFLVETKISNILTAKYQEALLDFDLHMQDGTSVSLSNVPDSDYELAIETLDSSVVAVAPTGLSSSQRIIALGQASGYFLKASLNLAPECRITSKYSLLAKIDVFVHIQFDSMNENNNIQDEINRTEFPQNDIDQESLNFKSPAFVPSDVIQIPKNSQFSNPSTNKVGRKYLHYQQHFVTPFEIGMYVLLIAFVCGILVFVGSCVIYASKFKPVRPNHIDLTSRNDHLKTRRNFINAHDWVWLGRSTFNSSIADGNVQSTLNNNNSADVNQVVNITENPFQNFPTTNRENDNSIELRNYKPPVPPHQNLGIVQLPKRHHKKHRGQKSFKNSDHSQNMYRSDAFHFDDLSPVSFQNSQVPKRNDRIENAVVLRNLNTSNAIEQSSNTNYKQIMHHFHNLKESNA